MRFYSKKGPVLTIILLLTTVTLCVSLIKIISEPHMLKENIAGVIIIGLSITLMVWSWLQTYYEIIDGYLKIVAGPYRKKIDISTINKIKRTKNPLSSPALSMDRIEITYNKWDMAIISPKYEERFCEMLVEQNPQIDVDLESKKKY